MFIPIITIELDTKYDTTLNANSKNVSDIGLTLIKLKCLNAKLVTNPKNSPIESEMTPSKINQPKIMKGVAAVNDVWSNDETVLYRIIAMMSLNTPSPKTQLKSFGC